MMPRVVGRNRIYEWAAPIDYGKVVFCGAGLFPNSGLLYHDAGPRKNRGTLVNGPTWKWVPELGRWGMVLNGSSQYMEHRHMQMTFGTWAAWIKPTNLTGYQTAIAAKYNGNYWFGKYTVNGQIQLWCGGLARQSTTTTLIQANVLSHIAATWDGANVRFYHNGKLDSTIANTNAPINDASITLRVGADRESANPMYFHHGMISDALMSSVVCSSTQIRWLANPANNPWQPWRRKWWPVSGAAPTARRRLMLAPF